LLIQSCPCIAPPRSREERQEGQIPAQFQNRACDFPNGAESKKDGFDFFGMFTKGLEAGTVEECGGGAEV
jgi:hypothetical protein